MPRRTKAQLARDKARKLVQNLYDEFKVTNLRGYGAYLLLDGPDYFDDNYLAHHPVKLLPFDISDTAILNSAPSFFEPWPISKLKDHPVDVEAMGGDGLESLEIDDPIPVNTMGGEYFELLESDDPLPDPSSLSVSARDISKFITGQYFHVPRANLGPGSFETLYDHSKWCPISCVTLSITLAVPGLTQISYSLPHALYECDYGITPYLLEPSTSPWETEDIWEYGDDAPIPPHIIATTLNYVEGEDMKLLRSELMSILQLMVNRLGEEGHENDAIVPVSLINTRHVLFLTRTRY
jgi:hypothetical protein